MATQQAILDYLAGPALNELMMTMDVRRGLPKVLPDEFFRPGSTKLFSDKFIFPHRSGQRQPATIVNALSPSRQYVPPQQKRGEGTCITAREHIKFDSETLMLMKSNVPIINDRILRKIEEDLRDWKIRFENLRTAAAIDVITLGKVAYLPAGAGTAPDALAAGGASAGGVPVGSGQIVPASTSNAVVVDMALTYGGTNALNKTSQIPNAVGAPTVTDWSSSTTNIPAAVRAIIEGFIKTSNYTPMHVLYGRSIPDYFIANTAMQTFLSRQPRLNDEFMTTGELPNGLLDLNWYPGWKAYYVDYQGNIQSPFPANQIAIYPAVTDEWYEMVQGGHLIPTGLITPGMSQDEALAQSRIEHGFASYLDWITDPLTWRIIGADSFLPVIKNPNVVWQITVS